ncbi:MAG TPA: HlyD family secretion protein [Caulobacteraceae bacterium]|nr:HlyD family secretion protein [Caulobacteraceae bacterium]
MVDHAQKDGDTHNPEARRGGLLAHPLAIVIAVVILTVLAVGALLWWLNARNYESTDDAFIDTHIVRLAPQAAGRVTAVLAPDNALVRAGQTVMILDSSEVAAQVSQARAQWTQARAQTENAVTQVAVDQTAWRQSLADLAATKAPARKADEDLARYRRLQALNPLAVAGQQLDQADAAARQADAQVQSAARSAQGKAGQIAAARDQLAGARAAADSAKAQLDRAAVTLGYTRLVAPITGHVTQRTVSIGDYVQPGTQVMAVVPQTLWITANFKETQLKLMRPGQKVSIKIDACPQGHIRGHIDSIQHGAGQAFALLPPQNATGNYVKVVQRVPVKILFDEVPNGCVFGPGMSVTPTVRVR